MILSKHFPKHGSRVPFPRLSSTPSPLHSHQDLLILYPQSTPTQVTLPTTTRIWFKAQRLSSWPMRCLPTGPPLPQWTVSNISLNPYLCFLFSLLLVLIAPVLSFIALFTIGNYVLLSAFVFMSFSWPVSPMKGSELLCVTVGSINRCWIWT